jgi:histidinol phosphatase-like PHP family hydrolase
LGRLKGSDFHVHTTMSECAHCDAAPETVIARGQEERLTAIGISDHIFSPADLSKPRILRAQLPRAVGDMAVYVGCEAEMHAPDRPTVDRAYSAERDFVLMAATHLHFLGRKLDEMDIPEVVDLIFDLMFGILESGCADIIAHPFRVNEGWPRLEFPHLVSAVERDTLMCLAQLAARRGVAAECSPRLLRACPDSATWLFRCFLEAGCKLSIGSDAHWPVDIGCNTDEFASEDDLRGIGLTDESLWTIEDRVAGTKERAG